MWLALQCVATCYSLLPCVVACSIFWRGRERTRDSKDVCCVAVCCSVLHYVAVGVITWREREHTRCCEHVRCVAVCYSVLCRSVSHCGFLAEEGAYMRL